jgi:hypothetical protein
MYIDEVIVDYRQNQQLPYNYTPRIQSIAALATIVELGDTTTLFTKATDIETKTLDYNWEATDGTLIGSGTELKWVAPAAATETQIRLIVTDGNQQTDTAFLTLTSTAEVNIPPVIEAFSPTNTYTTPGGTIAFQASVFDQNEDQIRYEWSADDGTISGTEGNINWTAPNAEGIYTVRLQVYDEENARDERSIRILVRDFTQIPNGELIAHYPFSGNANDISGNNLNGEVFGAKIISDSKQQALEAYFFDGINDRISVPNSDLLNFTEGISVNVQFRARQNNEGEVFLVSHGSWQNRWKVSMTPDKKIRWTIRNASGAIVDLDSQSSIIVDSVYHVSANYDGAFLSLYLNGRLESFQAFSGAIRKSPVGLEMAQMLPDEDAFNFSGYLEDVQIYNQALQPDQVALLAGVVISSVEKLGLINRSNVTVFPNPTTDFIQVDFTFSGTDNVPVKKVLEWSIIGLDGRTYLAATKAFETNNRLNISAVENGVYILKIKIAEAVYYQKVIKK